MLSTNLLIKDLKTGRRVPVPLPLPVSVRGNQPKFLALPQKREKTKIVERTNFAVN